MYTDHNFCFNIGAKFNMEMPFYQYSDSLDKDEMVMRLSYPYNGNSYIVKTSLFDPDHSKYLTYHKFYCPSTGETSLKYMGNSVIWIH